MDELNSQLIVAKFVIMHAGGQLLLRFQNELNVYAQAHDLQLHKLCSPIRAPEIEEWGWV